VKDVQTKLRKEECALSTGQKRNDLDLTLKEDARIKLKKEVHFNFRHGAKVNECVSHESKVER
jgi:hypothetical protein